MKHLSAASEWVGSASHPYLGFQKVLPRHFPKVQTLTDFGIRHLEDHIIAVARRWSDPAKVATLIHEWMQVEVNAIAKTKSLLAR